MRFWLPAALAALVVLASACSATSGTPRQQVNQWSSQFGYRAINAQIQSDLSFIDEAMKAHDFAALQTNCEGFPGDVEPLYESLPTPDRALSNEIANATQGWFNAAADCAKATSVRSPSYRAYLKALASGNASDAIARKRLASYGVR